MSSQQLARFYDWLDCVEMMSPYFGAFFSNVPLVRRLRAESPTGHWSLGLTPSWRRIAYEEITDKISLDEWNVPIIAPSELRTDSVTPGEYRTSRDLFEAGLQISLPVFASDRGVWNKIEEAVNMGPSVRAFDSSMCETFDVYQVVAAGEVPVHHHIVPLRSGIMRQALVGQNPWNEISIEILNSEVCYAKNFAGVVTKHYDNVPYRIKSAAQEITMPWVIG